MNEEVTEKPQILFVDDSKVIRRAAVKMLGDDYQIHEAVDGMDGWQQLQRNDAISVVFADMQMPEMGGMELLTNIRNSDDDRLGALPVIIITGVGDTEEAKRAVFDAGAGRLGDYDACCWQVLGTGQFRPGKNSNPHIGERGQLETVDEFKIEMMVAADVLDKVIAALLQAHPYEEPAYHYWPVNPSL